MMANIWMADKKKDDDAPKGFEKFFKKKEVPENKKEEPKAA